MKTKPAKKYTWRVMPETKKSTIELQHWSRDGDTLVHQIGWRWGEFLVYTTTELPPVLEAGVDIYNCEYETELVMTDDGCWEEYNYDECSDQTKEWLQAFFDQGNTPLDLEPHGWSNDETEMIIDCDMTIEKVEDEVV